MKKLFRLVVFSMMVLLIGTSVTYASSFYSYSENIDALIGSPTIITLNAYSYGSYASISDSGATIDVNPASGSVVVTNAYILNDTTYKYVDTHYAGYGNQSYTISFTDPVSQFGLGLYDLDNLSSQLIAYDKYDQELEKISSLPIGGVTSYFAGFRRTQADIARVEFVCQSSDSIGIDNISFSRVATVPIPPTVYLFGVGLVGLIGLRRTFFRK